MQDNQITVTMSNARKTFIVSDAPIVITDWPSREQFAALLGDDFAEACENAFRDGVVYRSTLANKRRPTEDRPGQTTFTLAEIFSATRETSGPSKADKAQAEKLWTANKLGDPTPEMVEARKSLDSLTPDTSSEDRQAAEDLYVSAKSARNATRLARLQKWAKAHAEANNVTPDQVLPLIVIGNLPEMAEVLKTVRLVVERRAKARIAHDI